MLRSAQALAVKSKVEAYLSGTACDSTVMVEILAKMWNLARI